MMTKRLSMKSLALAGSAVVLATAAGQAGAQAFRCPHDNRIRVRHYNQPAAGCRDLVHLRFGHHRPGADQQPVAELLCQRGDASKFR